MGSNDLIKVADINNYNAINWRNWLENASTIAINQKTVESHKRQIALDILKNGYTEDKAKEFDSII